MFNGYTAPFITLFNLKYEYLNLYRKKVSIHCKTITIPGMIRIRITTGIKKYKTPHSIERSRSMLV